jgi:hypothetical protein
VSPLCSITAARGASLLLCHTLKIAPLLDWRYQAPGTPAWEAAIPPSFRRATGLTPPKAFWVVRDPADPSRWWALDPVNQDNHLWAGEWHDGAWTWWGVDPTTGMYASVKSSPEPQPLYVPVYLAMQLFEGKTTPASSGYNEGRYPWNAITGHVGPAAGWTATSYDGEVTITVYLPSLSQPLAAYGIVTSWTKDSIGTGKGWFSAIVAEPNRADTWMPSAQ